MFKRLQQISEATLRQAAMPLVSLLIGLLAMTMAISVAASPLGPKHIVAVVGFWLAQTLIGAGVVAGVLRALQSSDYFAHALRKVLYEDDLPEGPIDYHRAWRNLTLGLLHRRFQKFEVAPGDLLPVSLIGDAEYYYSEHKRYLKIGWQDRAKGIVNIVDHVETILITGDVGRQVRFGNWFIPEADSTRRRSVECRFSGGFERTFDNTQMVVKDGRHGFEVELPPSSEIRLVRKFEKQQDLHQDPILNYMSDCLVHRPRVDVRCDEGLRFYFRRMGMPANFTPEGGNIDLDSPLREVVARYDGLCFRNQGYIIVIVKE